MAELRGMAGLDLAHQLPQAILVLMASDQALAAIGDKVAFHKEETSAYRSPLQGRFRRPRDAHDTLIFSAWNAQSDNEEHGIRLDL